LAVVVSFLVGLMVGCDDGESTPSGSNSPPSGQTGQTVQGTVTNNVISVPVSIEGAAALPFVVDTGSPLTRLDPARHAGVVAGVDQVTTLDVGGVHLMNVTVVVASLCGVMMCQGPEPAGLLGADTLVNTPFTLDYRSGRVTFGAASPPAGAGAPVTVTFDLEGGGQVIISNQVTAVPATRIAVTTEIEGRSVPMVLDTGSSTVVLAPELFDAIVADGRTQTNVKVFTVAGRQEVPAIRLQSASLPGAAQSDVEAMRAPLPLTLLEREVGHPVQGLLGGSYLHNYLTTIDYPARTITLRPY